MSTTTIEISVEQLVVELAADRRTAERLAPVVRAAIELVGRRVATLAPAQRARLQALPQASVQLSNNTLLGRDAAERLADAIVEQLLTSTGSRDGR